MNAPLRVSPEILSCTTLGGRYRLDEFRSRFGDVVWFLMDTAVRDLDGHSVVIRQVATREEAVAGLDCDTTAAPYYVAEGRA